MNFTNPAEKIALANKLFLVAFFCLGCSSKSQLIDVKGDIQVKIPVSVQSGNSSEYRLEVVTLKGLASLKEVSGFFAQFFFSPGQNKNQLVGDAPSARFIKSSSNVYIPIDHLSQQMATIYFHIQNLNEFSQHIGAGEINQGAMKIGIETKVGDSALLAKNNAFYDGQSDAMLFVPFTSNQLPIAVNSGIIAHEYFHSLFFKLILKDFNNKKTDLEAQELVQLYNETYLRGINEGLADFWGWVYTNDDDFIRWSLAAFSKDRKLVLSEQSIGQYESADKIRAQVAVALKTSSDPTGYLSNYIYNVGTPVARYLKQFTTLMIESGLSATDAKLKVADTVIRFLKKTAKDVSDLSQGDNLSADELFLFIANEKLQFVMNQQLCEFTLSYIQKNESHLSDECIQQSDDSYQIKSQSVVVK